MEGLWGNWISSLKMGDNNFFGQCYLNSSDEEKFLTEIVQQQPGFSVDSVYHSFLMQYNTATTIVDGCSTTATTATSTMGSCLSSEEASFDEGHGNMLMSNSSNSIIFQDAASQKPAASSPTTFILSFENSIVEPALHRPSPKHSGDGAKRSSTLCSKRTLNNHIIEPKAKQGAKKVRSSSETQDHIMAERKTRQELTERFIALSATIPGLKKNRKVPEKTHVWWFLLPATAVLMF